ncbi:hypothetical protein DAPPUDRAFT_115347 [Daphnia pulex]|uniref:Uncharacterized protein n=1 Tax=Daphnia pulex TaxID=6669 RepID=E9HL27_DAPPU|nr:hypothetical protein DAPPUDRAFT_115347 [Daphnia pulex]|eukprot:EFX67557.1 hypothetical protein DAPPUDRAFT_115347 [Daphnia pulex]
MTEPEKIKQTLQFWRDVDNKIMANIELDDACLDGLPRDDVSPAMFMIDDETLPTSDGETSDTEASNEVRNPSTERLCGGPSLLRSHEESESAVPLSATVTIGSSQSDDMNVHELAADLLNTTAQQPGKEIVTSTDDEKTFVVRPSTTFASDSDSEFLEKHYPDLFPFGRGGFGETRKIKISRKAYLAYLLNLSTRQFQHVDFLLQLYDMTTRQEVSNVSFVRSKLPSRSKSGDGHLSYGEAFGRLTSEAIQLAGQYKLACAKATNLGQRLPPPPPDIDGVGLNFFTNISLSTQPMQHSQAAANRDRHDVLESDNDIEELGLLKTISEIQTMNRYSEDVIIVDIFGLYVDCSLPGISENQQFVICNELGGKRVFIDKIQLILGQLGNYKQVLVKGKTILRLKAFKEWLEEIFDSDDENDQEKDLLKEIGLKERDLKERDLKEKDLKEKDLKEKDLKEKDFKKKDSKEKDLKQKDLKGKKDQLSDEDN